MSYLPYELIVVPKEKLSKSEYFTVSATGVMHIKKGKSERFSFWISHISRCVMQMRMQSLRLSRIGFMRRLCLAS